MLLNQGVLTCGSGSRRVVLDYEAGLIYQYSEPENVLAVFESNKWIILKRPYYRSAGWGNSSGDAEGATRIDNARSLLNSINAQVYELNAEVFMTPQEMNAMNKAISLQNQAIEQKNKLIEKQNKLVLNGSIDRVEQVKKLEPFKITKRGENAVQKGQSPKGLDAIAIAKRMEQALAVFLEAKGKATKIDTYRIEKNLVTQSVALQSARVVAFRDDKGQVFMNSERLSLSGFENAFMGGQSLVQSSIRKIAKYSIPFNVLESAKLKLSETRIVEQGPESTHTAKRGVYGNSEEIHFTGALLLENHGRKFLMDIDRIEIKHGIFNAFFVEVDSKAASILEAYESMKPAEVKQAEASGVEVKRQGEWFFIATDKKIIISEKQELRWKPRDDDDKKPAQFVCQMAVAHGKGRPNNLYKPFGFGELDNLVCGLVTHQGREHHELQLGRKEIGTDNGDESKVELVLWKLVPNSTVSNFTITGDID